jgi:hypothetical protein
MNVLHERSPFSLRLVALHLTHSNEQGNNQGNIEIKKE